jgi:hypothetical protein
LEAPDSYRHGRHLMSVGSGDYGLPRPSLAPPGFTHHPGFVDPGLPRPVPRIPNPPPPPSVPSSGAGGSSGTSGSSSGTSSSSSAGPTSSSGTSSTSGLLTTNAAQVNALLNSTDVLIQQHGQSMVNSLSHDDLLSLFVYRNPAPYYNPSTQSGVGSYQHWRDVTQDDDLMRQYLGGTVTSAPSYHTGGGFMDPPRVVNYVVFRRDYLASLLAQLEMKQLNNSVSFLSQAHRHLISKPMPKLLNRGPELHDLDEPDTPDSLPHLSRPSSVEIVPGVGDCQEARDRVVGMLGDDGAATLSPELFNRLVLNYALNNPSSSRPKKEVVKRSTSHK